MRREVIPASYRESENGVTLCTQILTTLLIFISLTLTNVSTYPFQTIGNTTLDKLISANDPIPLENRGKGQKSPYNQNQIYYTAFSPNSLDITTENSIVTIQGPENSKERTDGFEHTSSSLQEGISSPLELESLELSQKYNSPPPTPALQDSSKQLGIVSLNPDTAFSLRFPAFSPELDESLRNRFAVGPLSILHEFERHHFGI